MSILVNVDTRVLVQGITGREGSFHTRQMLAYGTRIVAGVTPGRGGESVEGVPVFDEVATAVDRTGANTAIVYVPASFCADALVEVAYAKVPLIIAITEGIPVWDMIRVVNMMNQRGVRLLGANCPGAITPDVTKVGIMPGHIHRPGRVGVVSRSGTLTYEVVWALTRAGYGQSSCVGIGGDPVQGTSFVDVLALFEADDQTDAVVMIGEIGGAAEERAAEFIAASMTKPVVGFIAGRAAPEGKRMGHAGAIISGSSGRAASKIAALERAGVPVAEHPDQIPERLRERGCAGA